METRIERDDDGSDEEEKTERSTRRVAKGKKKTAKLMIETLTQMSQSTAAATATGADCSDVS